MNKADVKRTEITGKIAAHVLTCGLSGVGIREMASAAGISDRMLLYYFSDKDAIVGAVLDHIADQMTMMLNAAMSPKPLPYDALKERVAMVMGQDEVWPYLALWLEIVAAAGRGDPLFRRIGERIGRSYLLWVAGQMDSREKGADSARLLATIEGSIVLRAVGLDEVAQSSLA